MTVEVIAPRRPRRKNVGEVLPDTPDPIEIAMIAAASGKPLPDAARNVLEKHARLIDCQAELTQAQCSELKLRRVGERVRAALWAILAVAALVVVGLLVSLLIRAARADALIVESFRVPPAMASQGLSGEVVASQVLDKLAEMQAGTESTRAASSYDNNWGDELKIDIPNTGATADQLWKLLRAWLGKETRISGEIIDTRNGLALTTRVGGTPGRRFVSKTEDLDALITQGAELIFQQSQPYRYSIYLTRDPKRFDDGTQSLEQLTRDSSDRERKWAFNGLSWAFRVRGEFGPAISAAQKALAIDPEMIPALSNLASAYEALGQDQAYVDTYRREQEVQTTKEYDPRVVAANRCGHIAGIAFASRNPKGLDEAAECLSSAGGSASEYVLATRLNAMLLRHDAGSMLAVRIPVTPNTSAVNAASQIALARLLAETDRGSSSQLAAALDNYRSAMAALSLDPQMGAYTRSVAFTWQWPVETEALVRIGRLGEAAALIAKTPSDCYVCARDRGLVAEAAGNLPDAQRWYAEAARQAPRLAPAFADWGRLLVKGRRFDAAQLKLKEAVRLAPNWADPLKYWGDALAAQGKSAEAIAKYDAALKLAPKWQEARAARARVAAR